MTSEDLLIENDYENVIILKNESYDGALIGVSSDGRAIYDYDLMVEWLMNKDGMSAEEAADWIDYNTIGSLYGNDCPIVMFRLGE